MLPTVFDEIPECSTRITGEIECLFCKAKIKVLYKPQMLQFKVSRIAARTKRTPFKTEEKCILLVDKCLNCGKRKKEIKKRIKREKKCLALKS
jgi:hypothetical protein